MEGAYLVPQERADDGVDERGGCATAPSAEAGRGEGGAEHDKFEGFEVVLRVVNPEGANGWEIVKASDHKAVWKSCHPWCAGFGVDIEVIPVLTDSEFLEVHNELKS